MGAQAYALVARFETPSAVFHAAEKVRDAGFRNWDVISPMPIHGLDGAMGVKRSIVPRISLCGGITGFCTGMSLIYFADAYTYPLVVGGKPMFSPMFAFPVSYELTILFTAFATLIGMFVVNGLPMHYHPVLKMPEIRKAMDDTFYIVIETRDPRFNATNTRALLEQAGGRDVREIEA